MICRKRGSHQYQLIACQLYVQCVTDAFLINGPTQPAYLTMQSAGLEPIKMGNRLNVLLAESAGGHPHTTQPCQDLRPRQL